MRHEDDRAARLAQVLHAPEAATLELGVADGEHLVDEKDLRLEMRGDGEREAHRHAARVALDRRVDELLDAGELDDLRELALDLPPLHPEHRAVQEDVLAAGELGMEAGSHLQQASDPTTDLSAAARRRRDPGEDLEQRRLARAVAADDAEHLALLHLERDVPERPDLLVVDSVVSPGEAPSGRGERVAKRPVGALQLADPVALRKLLRQDCDAHQIVSAKRGSERRKYQSPTTRKTAVAADADERLPELGRRRAEDPPLEPADDRRHRD